MLGRFLLEARAAARIQHPNVATLYRVGELEGRPYLVSEFVRGTPLDELEGALSSESLLRLALDLTRGLTAAHRRGVLHRDIKPGNAILAETGEAKLLDFGLAKLLPAIAPTEPPGQPAPESGGDAEEPAFSEQDEEDLRDMTLGQLVGTPYFMAPEIWRFEEATERSDLYSLGMLLYELCAGRGPFRDAPLTDLPKVVQNSDPRPLHSVAPAIPERLSALVDRCLRREPAERFASADHLLAQLSSLRPSRVRARVPDGNPYRGLRPFEPEHRSLFFGRQQALAGAIERLRMEPFLLVTGDSGVGKSSLCAAGILPLVTEGDLEDGMSWAVARLLPGREPVLAAAAALAPILRVDEDDLEEQLRAQPAGLARIARRNLESRSGLLVYIDQLEELVTQASPEEAAALSEALGALAAGIPGLRLLSTARSDFLSRLEALPGFQGLVSRSLFLLAPLSRDEVREAIVGPASVKGARFESEDMVDRLVESTMAAGGATPLLQFALAELWERRSAREVIGEEALEALGGVAGALSRHADNLLAALRPVERTTARTILLRLVTLERTRTRRLKEELASLSPHTPLVLEALVRGRLLVASETTQGAAYEIAHEALVGGWDTLAGWLAEEAEARALLHRVEEAAAEWRRHDRSRELLWSKRQLGEVADLDQESLTPGEREFLEESRRARRRSRRLRQLSALAALALAFTAWAGARLKARHDLDREIRSELQKADRQAREARDLDARLRRVRAEAFRAFDEGRLPEGEEVWAKAVSLRDRVRAEYREASEPLERALLLAPGRADLRRRYADLLYERAVLAERERRLEARDEILSRMLLYDDDGRLERRWQAPARLDLTTEPPGASVRLLRYRREDGRRSLEEIADLGETPARHMEVEPGSILLELTLKGHAPVRYPILLGRGERQTLTIPLIRSADVPDGFLWIPPGEARFGSGDDESIRAFFNAIPQHPVKTAGYWIARFETTFGDWIEYLEALSPEGRAQRTPRLGDAGVKSMRKLALRELRPGTWELRLQPGTTPLRAMSGEPIHYGERELRAEQDWLKFPVVGVSAEDARAYASWLDDSGRVPGARLCTEMEWERAARGADRRTFPHGDVLKPEDANFDETYGKQMSRFGPDEVGSHPRSRSPFGVHDMAGNVWEWVVSDWSDRAVARGGSYDFAASTARIANRETPEVGYRDISLGVRICASGD